EDGGEPTVGDLGGKLDRAGGNRGEVDGGVGAERTKHQPERLPEPGRARPLVRDRIVLAVVLEPLAPKRGPNDLHVLARLRKRPSPRLSVPALDDLRAGDAETESEPAAAHEVEGRRGHGGRGPRPGRGLPPPPTRRGPP